jgi:pycsar effector protein
MTTDQIVEFHWKILARYDHYIATTNVKAAFLIAWNTFAIGTVGFKSPEIISRFSGMAKTEAWVMVCLLIIVVSSLASLWETFRVVSPFLESPRQPLKYHSLVFFRHVAEFGSDAEFNEATIKRSLDELASDLAAQVFTLARGLSSKFSALRYAIGLLLFVQIPAFIVLIATHVIVALCFHL